MVTETAIRALLPALPRGHGPVTRDARRPLRGLRDVLDEGPLDQWPSLFTSDATVSDRRPRELHPRTAARPDALREPGDDGRPRRRDPGRAVDVRAPRVRHVVSAVREPEPDAVTGTPCSRRRPRATPPVLDQPLPRPPRPRRWRRPLRRAHGRLRHRPHPDEPHLPAVAAPPRSWSRRPSDLSVLATQKSGATRCPSGRRSRGGGASRA